MFMRRCYRQNVRGQWASRQVMPCLKTWSRSNKCRSHMQALHWTIQCRLQQTTTNKHGCYRSDKFSVWLFFFFYKIKMLCYNKMQSVCSVLMLKPLRQTNRQKCCYVIMEKLVHENCFCFFKWTCSIYCKSVALTAVHLVNLLVKHYKTVP